MFQISDNIGELTILCGFGDVRPPLETRSSMMFVEFYSNNYLVFKGFNVTYEAIESKLIYTTAQCIQSGISYICEGYFSNELCCICAVS